MARAAALLISAALGLLGAFAAWQAARMTYATSLGPGPGFFPWWLGLLLAAVAVLAIVEQLLAPPLTEDAAGDEPLALPRALAILAAVAGFALAIEPLGFVPTMFALLAFLLLLHGVRPGFTLLAVALAGSLGVGYAFNAWLGVFLPPAPLGLLAPIGL